MPKLKFKKDEAPPTQVPGFEPVNILEWLGQTETTKDKDGNDVTTLANISQAVANELEDATEIKDEAGRVIGLKSDNIVAEILSANTKIDNVTYTDEYVGLRAITAEGMSLLLDGKMDVTFEGEGSEAREVPSVAKYFNQGFGILGRNAAAARIRTKVEGPDKALEAAARDLARAKGWTFDKALAKIKAMAEDD